MEERRWPNMLPIKPGTSTDLQPEVVSEPGAPYSCYSCGRLQGQAIFFARLYLCFDCAQTHGNKLQKRGRALERKIRRQQEKQSKAREE